MNFGVVSTFEFECYPQAPMVFFGDLIFPGERLPEVLVAADKWEAEMMSPKDLMLVVLTYLPDHGLVSQTSYKSLHTESSRSLLSAYFTTAL